MGIWNVCKKNTTLVFVLTVIVLASSSISAQSRAGKTAAEFLTIGVGAKAAGMSSAYTAMSEGADAVYWNPAGLTAVEGSEIMLSHFDWYQDLSLEHGAYAKKLNSKTVFASSITYLNYGTIKRYGINGEPLANDISVYDWAGSVSLGLQVSENLSVGFTAKYVNQKIDDISGSALVGDIGFKYIVEDYAIAGFLGNYGSQMKFDESEEKLPRTARLGISFYPFSQRIATSIEAEKKMEGNIILHHGIEYNLNEQYFLRSGYNYYMGESDRGFGENLSFGAGVNFESATIDYAFTASDSFTKESLHRFSLIFKFGN